MITTTTPSVEGRVINDYLDIVSGQAVLGVNVVRDMFAWFRNIVGGRARSYEKELERGRTEALADLIRRGHELKADAIVGVHVDIEAVGRSMLMVSVTGTAVRFVSSENI